MYGVCIAERGTIVFLRVRIITRGAEVTSSWMIPSRLGWAAIPSTASTASASTSCPLIQPIIEADEDVAGARRRVRLALDLYAVAARGDVHAEPLLDGDQVAVVVAEQRPEQVRLLELELEPRAPLLIGGNRGKVAARHQAATLSRDRAGHAVRSRGDECDIQQFAGLSVGFDVHRLQPGRAADHLARVLALALDQDLRVRAHFRTVERKLVHVDPVLQPPQPLLHDFARNLGPP